MEGAAGELLKGRRKGEVRVRRQKDVGKKMGGRQTGERGGKTGERPGERGEGGGKEKKMNKLNKLNKLNKFGNK